MAQARGPSTLDAEMRVGPARLQHERAAGAAAGQRDRRADRGALSPPSPELQLAGDAGGDASERAEAGGDWQLYDARRHVVSCWSSDVHRSDRGRAVLTVRRGRATDEENSSADLAAPLEGLGERHLIGVLEVTSDRQAACDARDAHTERTQQAREVER